ncbi:MAG: crossover junction endodeoxyribonuclease RuvC [Gemmatimonadota bacterium]
MARRRTTKGRPLRILAIDPGTRRMGVAVLDGSELAYHGVWSFRPGGPPSSRLREGRRVMIRLLKDFAPELVAFERTFFTNNRNAALLNVFTDELEALAHRHRARVVGFAPSTVKKVITGDGHAAKAQVAEAVASRFPQLRAYLINEPKWKRDHHGNMFDAVAVALTAAGSPNGES